MQAGAFIYICDFFTRALLEVSQLTQSALDGHNVAIFAYGQVPLYV